MLQLDSLRRLADLEFPVAVQSYFVLEGHRTVVSTPVGVQLLVALALVPLHQRLWLLLEPVVLHERLELIELALYVK